MWNKIYYWSEKNLIINHKHKIKAASSDSTSQSTSVAYDYPAPLPDYCVRSVNCLCFGQCRKGLNVISSVQHVALWLWLYIGLCVQGWTPTKREIWSR